MNILRVQVCVITVDRKGSHLVYARGSTAAMPVDRGTESNESHELGEGTRQAGVQEISESRAERDDARADAANWEQSDLSRAPDADEHLRAQKPWTAEERAAIDAAAVNRQDSPGVESTSAEQSAELHAVSGASEHPATSPTSSTTTHEAGLHAADETASTTVGTDSEPAGRYAGAPGEMSAPTDDPGEGTDGGESRDAGSGDPSQSEEAGQPPKYVVVLDDARSNPSFDPGSNTWSDRQHGEYVGIRPGEIPPGMMRADRPLFTYDKPVTSDYSPHVPPTAKDRYLVRDQANPVPLFDGPPAREQTAQGRGHPGLTRQTGGATHGRYGDLQGER